MSRIKIEIEGPGGSLFLIKLKEYGKLSTNIFVNPVNRGSILNSTGVNCKEVYKKILLAKTKGMTDIIFIADLEQEEFRAREKQINDFLTGNTFPINVKICLSIKMLEAWLIADIEGLKTFLGNHTYIPYSRIITPTDNIQNPFKVIDDLFKKSGKRKGFTKNASEASIARYFELLRAKDNSTSFNTFYQLLK